MVEKGGTPDLVPLGAPEVSKKNATLVPPVHSLVPPPAAPLSPPMTVVPSSAPVVPKNPPLQTYSNDFRDRMKETHASTATVLAAEQDNAPRTSRVAPEEPPRVRLPYVIAGALLLVASVAGGIAAYVRYRTVSAPTVSAPVVSAPIFVDDREEISGDGSALVQAIMDSVNRPLAAGTVRLLSVARMDSTGSPPASSSADIFASLPLSAPEALLRNMKASGGMTGVIHVGGVQSPFFILSVSSYSTVFSGMLQWEPLMPEYLSGLFLPYTTQSLSTTTAASTASTTAATTTVSKSAEEMSTASVFAAGFSDATIVNHDVRVYHDAAGREVLLYGFWNQSTLIIARDTTAFTEIVGRLATAPPQ